MKAVDFFLGTDQRYDRWLLRLGLVITILAITADPFAQQLVQLNQGTRYVDNVNGTQATSPRAIQYTLGDLRLVNSTRTPDGKPLHVKTAQPDLRMEAAILNGLAQPKSIVQRQVIVTCPTGNCTWDKLDTLGVCHRCADLTDSLERVDDFGDFVNYMKDKLYENEENRPWAPEEATAIALPNGHFLANTNGCEMTEASAREECYWTSRRFGETQASKYPMTVYSTGNPNRTNVFQDIETLIWSTSVIHMDEKARKKQEDEWYRSRGLGSSSNQSVGSPEEHPWSYWPTVPVRATECALYYCVKEAETHYADNLVGEVAREVDNVKRTPESFQPSFDNSSAEDSLAPENVPEHWGSLEWDTLLSAVQVADLTLNHTDPKTGTTTSYVVSEASVKSISSFLQDALLCPWRNETEAIEEARKRIPSIVEMYNGYIWEYGPKPNAVSGIWRDSESNVEERFETLAISMTNDIRRNGGIGTGTAAIPDEPLVGRMTIPTTEYQVVWYWISLHGLVLVGSVVFCAATISYSQHVPVWKSHSLATMSQGATVVDFGANIESSNLEELEKRAKITVVNLAENEKGSLLSREDAIDSQAAQELSPPRGSPPLSVQ